MKPLTNCPYCGCHLKPINLNHKWYEMYCSDYCTMKYHQYFVGDFDSDDLSYITFRTDHFMVYVYFNNGAFPNIVHFYLIKDLEAYDSAHPVIDNIPSDKIPTHELEYLAKSQLVTESQKWLDNVNEKLQTLVLFS